MRYGAVVQSKMFVTDRDAQIDNAILGIGGEAGEILDYFKKLRHHPVNVRKTGQSIRDEIGDLLWYVAALNELLFGDSLLNVARDNIRKLQGRFPERYNTVDVETLSL